MAGTRCINNGFPPVSEWEHFFAGRDVSSANVINVNMLAPE